MSKHEDGYFYISSNGNVSFVSYESLGGGGVFFLLIFVATIFIEKFGNFLIDNQWIVIIPALIAVLIRYFLYDAKLPVKCKICNVVSDTIRTIGMYGVLIALFSKILSCHPLDRIFVALGLGLLLAAAYALINMACKFFRRRNWVLAHFLISLASSLISLIIYLNQVAGAGVTLPDFEELLSVPLRGIVNIVGIDAFVEFYASESFHTVITLLCFILSLPIVLIPILIGLTIGKKINREEQARLDPIGEELKKHLPNDADVYRVCYDGVSYIDKNGETHSVAYEQLGYESLPFEEDSVTIPYINRMGQWILKNIVSNPKQYKQEGAKDGLFYTVSLRTYEYIDKHTLKKW